MLHPIKLRHSTELETYRAKRTLGVPDLRDHRLLWGWIRLVLGLTQMAFAVSAVYLLARDGFHWRMAVSACVAGVAAIASRLLYAGRPDPRLEASLKAENTNEAE
jgi:hypothetical protein